MKQLHSPRRLLASRVGIKLFGASPSMIQNTNVKLASDWLCLWDNLGSM